MFVSRNSNIFARFEFRALFVSHEYRKPLCSLAVCIVADVLAKAHEILEYLASYRYSSPEYYHEEHFVVIKA